MTDHWEMILSGAVDAHTAVLASPYIKENALLKLLNSTPCLKSLTCVTRWNAGDLRAGVSDTSVRGHIVGRGGTFLLHPTLHAKYYRFDDVVLIGSANLTNPGLGLASNSNLEILTPASPEFDSAAFEHLLLSQSRPVSNAEFAIWQSIPVVPQLSAIVPESLILTWRPQTRDPQDLWLVYLGEPPNMLPENVLQQTGDDLAVILAPLGLDRRSFSTWVSAALLASPFVQDVRLIPLDAEPRAYIQLGQNWGLSPGDARYAAETVHNWLSVFGVDFSR